MIRTAMTTLLCLGYGYCASRYVALHGADHARILGTTRGAARSDGQVELLDIGSPALADALSGADMLLVSAAPDETGDPFLRDHAERIAAAGRRGPIVYLSTIGVYGDSGGVYIDEDAPLKATSPRGRRRIEAEAAWRELGARAGRPVAVLRLGGIYGPGRNAVQDIRDGDARCIVREGQYFNRIHVDDIAGAIAASFARRFDGAVNVVDDEPAAACDPVRFAAGLLGAPPPPAVPYDIAAATMSPMARSFWADNRRVGNRRLHDELGLALRYPTYREGLAALFAEGA